MIRILKILWADMRASFWACGRMITHRGEVWRVVSESKPDGAYALWAQRYDVDPDGDEGPVKRYFIQITRSSIPAIDMVIICPNHMVCVFDQLGKQIPEYQGIIKGSPFDQGKRRVIDLAELKKISPDAHWKDYRGIEAPELDGARAFKPRGPEAFITQIVPIGREHGHDRKKRGENERI